MASVIKAGNATDGVQVTSDNTGILELKTGSGAGTTAMTIGTDQSVTFAGAVSSSGNQTVTGNLTVDGNTTLGNANTDTILMTAAPSIGGAGLGMGFGFRNRIINGNMVVSQRLGTSSLLCSNVTDYTLDRWVVVSNPVSKLTVQQDAGGVTPPAGFSDYLGVTVTTAETITSGDFYNLVQFIEGYNIADLAWGTASAKTVTVSFWVRSSVTGTYSFAFRNNGETRSYVTTYTINAANTWEQKTITIPGDTSGTWNTTNGRGIEVNFDFGRASETTTANAWTASGNVRLAGTVKLVENASATFYITGVQLEKGSTATSFDYRPYGTELALCQRYYYRVSGNLKRFAVGYNSGTTTSEFNIYFPTSMRTSATALETSGTAADYRVLHNAGSTICSVVPAFGSAYPEGGWFTTTVASGLTTGQASQIRFESATAYLGWSAEL